MKETITAEQAIVLSILHEAETPLKGRQRIQKYAFLLDEELGDKYSLYTWKKYDYGPYSKRLNKDLKKLGKKDQIKIRKRKTFGGNTRRSYRITTNGVETVEDAINSDGDFETVVSHIQDVIDEWGDIPISNIIHDVYDMYPEYIENSVYRL